SCCSHSSILLVIDCGQSQCCRQNLGLRRILEAPVLDRPRPPLSLTTIISSALKQFSMSQPPASQPSGTAMSSTQPLPGEDHEMSPNGLDEAPLDTPDDEILSACGNDLATKLGRLSNSLYDRRDITAEEILGTLSKLMDLTSLTIHDLGIAKVSLLGPTFDTIVGEADSFTSHLISMRGGPAQPASKKARIDDTPSDVIADAVKGALGPIMSDIMRRFNRLEDEVRRKPASRSTRAHPDAAR
ncbi:uncharacterized protein LAESUDRAFT_552911, partial [Laetiporus sulphureus 93-53]